LIFLVPWVQQIVRVDLRTVVIEVPSQDLIIIQVEQYLAATNMPAQTTLRSVLGQHELDDRTKEWGILVTAVEIRDVQLTDNMVKAIAKQAEAEHNSTVVFLTARVACCERASRTPYSTCAVPA
jgi:regulator of protease activity HflC (stomatin/prohibitin superfamily)